MSIATALKELDDAEVLLKRMTDYIPPHGREAAAKWLEDQSFDAAVGAASGIAYRTDERKKDRQRLVSVRAAVDALAELEDATVRAAADGPLAQAIKTVSAPVRKLVTQVKLAWAIFSSITDEEWKQLGKQWEALKVAIKNTDGWWAKTKAIALAGLAEIESAGDAAKRIGAQLAAIKDPVRLAEELLAATVTIYGAAKIRAAVKAALDARDEARLGLRARVLPQSKHHRYKVRRLTRA